MSANPTESHQIRIEARAALRAYIPLTGMFFVLAIYFLIIGIKQPDSGGLGVCVPTFSMGLAWIIWLRGFRLCVTEDKFEYRNGYYKTAVLSLREIREVKFGCIQVGAIPIPRLFITGSSNSIIVNQKPFRRQDIQSLIVMLRENANQK